MDKKINKFEEYEKMRSYLENPFYMPELERFYSKNQEGVVDDYYKEILTDTDNYTPGKVYAFSNENLDDLFNKLDLKDKKVLTVGSSGDQALYSLLYGAKDITIADLNIYTKPFVEFKIAAIKAFDKKAFLETFYSLMCKRETFIKDTKTYSKISRYLDGKSKIFWDNIFLEGDPELLYGFFQICGAFSYEKINYDKLRNKLLNNDYKINYIFANYEEFPKVLKEKYNLILLSNIKDYYYNYEDIFTHKQINRGDLYYNVLRKLYNNNLEAEGLIQINPFVQFRYINDLHAPQMFNKKLVNINDQPFVAKGKYKKLLKGSEIENELE